MATALSLSKLLLDRLAGLPGVEIGDANVPTDFDQGYAVVYPGAGDLQTTRLGCFDDSLLWDARVVCVGITRSQCLNTVDRVRSRIGGFVLDGRRSTSRLHENDAGPLIRDDSVESDIRYSITLHYRTNLIRS